MVIGFDDHFVVVEILSVLSICTRGLIFSPRSSPHWVQRKQKQRSPLLRIWELSDYFVQAWSRSYFISYIPSAARILKKKSSSLGLTFCADSYSASVPPPYALPHVKDSSHSAKDAGARLQLNTHTPLTEGSQSWLTILPRHGVGAY